MIKFNPSFPLNLLIKYCGQQIFQPLYHAIQGNYPLPHIHHLYRLRSRNQFENDLDFFLKHYHPVNLHQVLDHIQGKTKLPKNPFFLSFDDGLREVIDIAAPILQRKGISATIFLNSAFVDNKDLFFRYKASLLIEQLQNKTHSESTINQIKHLLKKYQIVGKTLKNQLLNIDYPRKEILEELAVILQFSYRDFLNQKQPYLTSEQVRQLLQKGFTIGAHSIDHPLFNQLDSKTQLFQMKESIQFIQQQFDLPYKVFSFPFTDYKIGATLFKTIEKEQIADLTFGCAGIKKERFPFHLQRFPMEGTDHAARRLLTSTYIYYFLKSIIGKNTIHRQ
jgi:peptidoglycan/xylan/chitin deacetylase (PgdA/CDA1 family)